MKGVKVKLEMTQCVKCGGKMPVLRVVKYGYRSCVDCSSVQKVGGVAIANHKTGNEIQIMPKEDADQMFFESTNTAQVLEKGVMRVYQQVEQIEVRDFTL